MKGIKEGASLVAQMVKNMPLMQETWVQSLGWEDPLEKGMATHSSTLSVLENSMDKRSLVGPGPWDHKELDTTEQLTLPLPKKIKINGNSCYELNCVLQKDVKALAPNICECDLT